MQAIRVHAFGDVDALVLEDVPRPIPGPGEVLLRVHAAGVGPWDAWIRSGRSVIDQPLPLTPGSDVAGVVEEVGPALGVQHVIDAQQSGFEELLTGIDVARALFFLVEVSSSRLEKIAALVASGELRTRVGDVLPLTSARVAHEMLAGRPHRRGKIVLTVDGAR